MAAQTKLSVKGQCVIPREVRDRLGWKPGDRLDVIETGDGVTLKRGQDASPFGPPLTWEEMIAQMPLYTGPPITLADMDRVIDDEMAERTKRKLAW